MTMSLSQLAVALAHALAGWALCGATMGIGLAKTSLNRALVIHAVAAPIIFALISTITSSTSPTRVLWRRPWALWPSSSPWTWSWSPC